MLVQYGYYELIINAERYWSRIKTFECELSKLKSKNINTIHQISQKNNNSSNLFLKLELKLDNKVLVTNSQTGEIKEVTLAYLKNITNKSLSFLVQYKFYELIINAKQYWDKILKRDRVKKININIE